MPAPRELPRMGAPDAAILGEYCAADAWSGDLQSGLFVLEATTRHVLGIGGRNGCGLLTLIQCFDPDDRARLIDLFERAASEPMRFSFATTIAGQAMAGQPVFCIGRSERQGAGESGTLGGIFIFPHL